VTSEEQRYGIDPRQPLPGELGRIVRTQHELVRGQLAQARAAASGDTKGIEEPVHEARKALKRLRALVRLLRPGIGRKVYRRHNELWRDAARRLSGGRDAHVLLELFAALAKDLPSAARKDLKPFGQALESRGNELDTELQAGGVLAEADEALAGAEEGLEALAPRGLGREALLEGLEAAYRRCRRALAEAAREGTEEALHEWRKTAKYARHHVEVLQPAAPQLLGTLEKLWHELTDALGEHNDLAVLGRELEAYAAADEVAEALAELRHRMRERQQKLRGQGFELGRQLLAEKPAAYRTRLASLLDR
jgi:CHAD domain-containing protein